MVNRLEQQLTEEYAQYLRELIVQAGKADAERRVFGAQKHQYHINPPLSIEVIHRVEQERHMKFPKEYVFYLTEVGDGGAGPSYGLYPFERVLKENQNPLLGQILEQTVAANITKEQWRAHRVMLDELGESCEADSPYERYIDRLCSNMISIGTQGCTYDNMLMLSGVDAGKILYIDWDLESALPFRDTGMTFLEWVEGYFKHVIDGGQLKEYCF